MNNTHFISCLHSFIHSSICAPISTSISAFINVELSDNLNRVSLQLFTSLQGIAIAIVQLACVNMHKMELKK